MNQLLQKSLRIAATSLAGTCRPLQIPALKKTTLTSNTSSEVRATQNKVLESTKITLIGQNHSITITSLKEAQKLAKRRDLHLVQVQETDSKSQRAVYKLVTAAEMLADDLKESPAATNDNKSAEKKSEKCLTIGSRITEHDLASRLKHISKWLAKRHEVCILVQGNADDMSSCERIVKTIEQSIKEPETIGKIVQKRTKGPNIKFNILPIETRKNANSQA